jgi:NAD(P)-dependent dehydrogenase (short-subunit alcohol dehydrogenase family)
VIDTGLKDKVAVVTGAGSRGEGTGIGKGIALRLAAQGVRLGLMNYDATELSKTSVDVAALNAEAIVAQGDVSVAADCERAVRATVQRFGRLDILVNVVGTEGARGNAVDVDVDDWDRGLRVNTTSMMLMTKYVVPHIAASGGGSIVNIASIAGMFAGLPSLLYPTSKGAVIMMTRAMALHHGRQGIRVNSVSPGLVYTPMVESAADRMREARRGLSMLGTEGTAWDIADAVTFLVSKQARWITGVNLPVDAGLTAQMPLPNPEY